MRKSKLLSVATSAALTAALLLTGCGSNGNGDSGSEADSGSSGGSVSENSSENTGSESSTEGESAGSELLPALSDSEIGTPGNCTIPRSNYVQYPYEGAEGITLKYWMSVHGNILKNPETSDSVQMTEWAKQWQELTGIKIEFVGPTSDADTAFGLMTVSDTLPDIIEWAWPSYAGGPSQAEADGVVTWLDDYISPDGPAADLWQWLQDNPHVDKSIKTDEGHYYCFPFIRGSKYLQSTSGLFYRKDLLEAAGYTGNLETIDDWTAALTALKDYGVEKPMTGMMNDIMSGTMNAYNIRPGMYISDTDGKVHYAFAEEGYKEWIIQMHEWVEAGLMDLDVTTYTNRDTIQQQMLNSISAVTYAAGGGQLGTWNNAAWAEPATYGENFELVAAQFPVAKSGDIVKYAGSSYDYATGSKGSAAITADCKYPEIAAAFLNFCYSQAGHYAINFGTEGVSYTMNADGTVSYTDEVMENPDGLAVAVAMAKYGRGNMNGPFVQDPDYIFGYYAQQQQKDALHVWSDNADSQGTLIPPVTLTSDEASEYARLLSDVNTSVGEYRVKWFNNGGVEEEWDAYVEQLKGMGLERMLEIQQTAVERYNTR